MGIIRKTRSVKALLKVFEQANKAMSTLELVERLHLQMNKSTVYRILERLEDDGTLHSFPGQNGLQWYTLNNSDSCPKSQQQNTHPHFQCKDCGKTESLSITIPVPKITEHSIESASLLLVGRCADCAHE